MLSGDPEFFEDARRRAAGAYESGNVLGGMGNQAVAAMEGTDVGALVAGANPIALAAQEMMDFVLSIENVQAVLNPLSTLLEGARVILEPFLNVILSGVVSILMELGRVIGDTLAPFINIAGTGLQILSGILKTTIIPVMQLLGKAFAWFNDMVIVPVGNAFIRAINGVIRAINKALGWLGVNIAYLQELLTTEQVTKLADNLKAISDAFGATISYLQKKLNDMISSQIKSAQDLYEVGAITATQYQGMVNDINKYRIDREEEMVSLADRQLDTLMKIHDRLRELYNAQTYLDSAGLTDGEKMAYLQALRVGNFAVGTPEITKDHLAMVHKGEAIIPKTFAEGIRSGEMVLSGNGKGSSGGDVYVSVNVEGNVTAEKDLAKSIAEEIYTQRRRGILTV